MANILQRDDEKLLFLSDWMLVSYINDEFPELF